MRDATNGKCEEVHTFRPGWPGGLVLTAYSSDGQGASPNRFIASVSESVHNSQRFALAEDVAFVFSLFDWEDGYHHAIDWGFLVEDSEEFMALL